MSGYVPVRWARFGVVGAVVFAIQLAVGFLLLPVTMTMPWLWIPVLFVFGWLSMKGALDLSQTWWKPVPARPEWTEDRL